MAKKENNHKSRTLDLVIAIGDKQYLLGTISFSLNKGELYYIFGLPSKISQNQLNINTGKTTGPAHHISWHNKTIHIKTFDQKIISKINCIDKTFLPNYPTIKPILVERFYSSNYSHHLIKKISDTDIFKDGKKQLILTLSGHHDFSLIFMLVPAGTSIMQLFTLEFESIHTPRIKLFYLMEKGQSIGRICAFEGWDLMIITASHGFEITLPNHNFRSPLRLLNFEFPTASILSMLQQAIANSKISKNDIIYWNSLQYIGW